MSNNSNTFMMGITNNKNKKNLNIINKPIIESYDSSDMSYQTVSTDEQSTNMSYQTVSKNEQSTNISPFTHTTNTIDMSDMSSIQKYSERRGNNSALKKSSELLINHLKKLEKENSVRIISNNLTKKTFPKVVNSLIDKLEHDFTKLNDEINIFNKEKKKIIDFDKKEMDKLKEIIQALYILVVTFDKSVELKKNNRINLLEQLRKTLEKSPGLLVAVDGINNIMEKQQNQSQLNQSQSNQTNQTTISVLNNINKVENKKNENVKSLNEFYNNLKKETNKQANINEGRKYLNNKNKNVHKKVLEEEYL